MNINQHIWIPDINESWILGKIISVKGENIVIQIKDIKKIYSSDQCLLYNNDNYNQENLIKLTHLHEASILNSLYIRYQDNMIYTFTGEILIAINPFKKIDLYNKNIIKSFNNGKKSPHPYFICQQAYSSIFKEKKNQSILVSGESGAGKTQTSKIIMEYLSSISKNSEINIDEKILRSNPILESFGNAKTLRNDNSSRFGKFIKINFSKKGIIIGCKIETYLLEKVRLIFQTHGERNFHIFYQILAGFSEELKKKYFLDENNFRYLSNGIIIREDGINDKEEFENLLFSFKVLGISDKDKNNIFNIIVSILQIGNIDFCDEGGNITDNSKKYLDRISKLLNISSKLLENNLCYLKININDEEILKPLNKMQCNNSRDSLSKYLYSILFDWLVFKINNEILGINENRFIGILDIFGFEVFEKNSFEQLCINYANESLQNQFNNYIFKSEQEEYEKEQISWKNITFPDNIECLKTLTGKNGVFSLLNAECLFPNGNDISFNNKLIKKFSQNEIISFNKIRKNHSFIVKHYAGNVCYNSNTFCDKNKNRISNELNTIIKNIDREIIKEYYDNYGKVLDNKVSTIRSETTSSHFIKQMKDLLKNIKETRPYYIRCIKPNDKNIQNNFVKIRVSEQLKYGGVLEAIRVSRAGYPIRFLHKNFYERYYMLDMNRKTYLDFIKIIVEKMDIETENFQIGLTKIFLKRKSYNKLEKRKEKILNSNSCIIQKNVRVFIQKKKYKETLCKIKVCQCIIRGKLAIFKYRKLLRENKSVIIQKNIRKFLCFKKYTSLLLSVKQIQNTYRNYINEKQIKHIIFLNNVTLLQSIYRGKKNRDTYLNYLTCIIKIQNLYRLKSAKDMLKQKRREKSSVVFLQKEKNKLEENLRKKEIEIEKIKKKRDIQKEEYFKKIQHKFSESEQANILLSEKMKKLLISNQEALEKIKKFEKQQKKDTFSKDSCIIF